MVKKLLLAISLILSLINVLASAANVLFSARSDGASHRRSMYPLAEALAARGHTVIMFAEIGREDNARGKNITENLVLLNISSEDYVKSESILNHKLWKKRSQSPMDIIFPWRSGICMTRRLFEEKFYEYQKVLDTKWDLIVIGSLFTTTGVTLAAQSRAPYVIFDTTVMYVPETISRSIPFPVASFPPIFVSETNFDNGRFLERLGALVCYVLDVVAFTIVNHRYYIPTIKSTAPNASLWNFYKSAEASLVDFPPAFDYPRPSTSDLFFIGGKCKSASLKPDSDSDWITFVEDSKSSGTIVVAFGHMVTWSAAPEETKVNFAHALNKLTSYRIVWQFKEEPPIKMLPHVRNTGWLPQTELLNHINTKLFISHGGLKSIMESICGEVPAIVIPFFAEQVRNAHLFVRSGAGETLDKLNLTIDNIYDTILKVLNGQRYKNRVKRLKKTVIEASPITPIENGVFWSEYIIRHKGLPEKWFKSKDIQMGWLKYFMVDVVSCFLSVTFVTIYISVLIVKKGLYYF